MWPFCGAQERHKDSSKAIIKNVADLLAAKLKSCGVYRQVAGNVEKGFADPTALFRFHHDDNDKQVLNFCHLWLQLSRDPLSVVSDLLYFATQVIQGPLPHLLDVFIVALHSIH
jgi:hypothetical protein